MKRELLSMLLPLTLAGGMLEASAGEARGRFWKAVAASGAVQSRTSGGEELAWERVSRGDELPPAAEVRTGRTGRITLTRSTSLLIVDPDTQVVLPEPSTAGVESSVVQTSGSVLYEVDGRSQPHFEVITPFLVAGVKGTSFLVTVDDEYASVTVQRGLVAVTDPADGTLLEVGPGESVMRKRLAGQLEIVRDTDRREIRRAARRLARMNARLDKAAADALAVNGQSQPEADGSGGSDVGDWANGRADRTPPWTDAPGAASVAVGDRLTDLLGPTGGLGREPAGLDDQADDDRIADDVADYEDGGGSADPRCLTPGSLCDDDQVEDRDGDGNADDTADPPSIGAGTAEPPTPAGPHASEPDPLAKLLDEQSLRSRAEPEHEPVDRRARRDRERPRRDR